MLASLLTVLAKGCGSRNRSCECGWLVRPPRQLSADALAAASSPAKSSTSATGIDRLRRQADMCCSKAAQLEPRKNSLGFPCHPSCYAHRELEQPLLVHVPKTAGGTVQELFKQHWRKATTWGVARTTHEFARQRPEITLNPLRSTPLLRNASGDTCFQAPLTTQYPEGTGQTC